MPIELRVKWPEDKNTKKQNRKHKTTKGIAYKKENLPETNWA